MIRLVHELPKRMRFSVPQLRGDRRRAVAFRARFRALGGVAAAEMNPLTGSLIVHHDGRPETRDRILRNLEEIARITVPQRRGPTPPATPAGLDDRIAEMIGDALAECLTKRLVRMALAALI